MSETLLLAAPHCSSLENGGRRTFTYSAPAKTAAGVTPEGEPLGGVTIRLTVQVSMRSLNHGTTISQLDTDVYTVTPRGEYRFTPGTLHSLLQQKISLYRDPCP